MYKNFQVKFLKVIGKFDIVNPVKNRRQQINVIKVLLEVFVFYITKIIVI